MNSTVAPSSPAAFFASATRCSGEPCVPASPREQTTKCTLRPLSVSLAITPPQPNSMSSGCAPKASNGPRSGKFSIGFIESVNGVTMDKFDFRILLRMEIFLFAHAVNIMAAIHNRLHPGQPRIAGGTDLHLGESSLRQRDEGISASVQFQCSIDKTGTDYFAFVGNVHKKLPDATCPLTKARGTRAHDANMIEQAHMAIHLKTKVRHVRGGRYAENFDQTRTYVIWQLAGGFILPAVGNLFEIER